MSLSTTEASFVRELVYRRSAIVLDESKHYLIQARLEALAAKAGFLSITELISATRGGATELHSRVVEALTTNETSFFRDVAPFECLKKQVLPGLLAKRQHERSLNIWCAACSTGQEPYSIAILIREHLPQLRSWTVRILATDLADHVLERAQSGRFSQLEVNRGLPAPLLVKHFERDGNNWVLKPELRERVTFSKLNLNEEWQLGFRPDVVFIRNVLIYFDVPTKRSILQRIRRTMRPDGALFLGAAETTLNIDSAWQRVGFENTSYYTIGDGG